MDTYVFYGAAIVLLIVSACKSKEKTLLALKKGWKAFEGILPQFLTVLLLVGIILAVLDTDTISRLIGNESGAGGVILSALIGAVTLIPGFVAFATAAELLKAGAGVAQIAAFVSSLMMVGIVTMPMEIKYFGKKTAILRNLLALIFTFIVASVFGLVMKR